MISGAKKAAMIAKVRATRARPEVRARMRAAHDRRRARAAGLTEPPKVDYRIALDRRLRALRLDADVEALLADIIGQLPRK